MNKKIFNVFLFAAGAVVGSAVTWKVVKTKYERIIQEEIDSFKETYTSCMRRNVNDDVSDSDITENDLNDEDEVLEDDVFTESDVIDYHALANKYRQSDDEPENDTEGGGDEGVPYINGPYVIDPSDFGDGNYDHDCHCISYYADGILADDWGVKLDIEDTIGLDAIDHFGDFAEDIVHVRNERLKADYEVARDPRNYADVVMNDPQMRMYAD